MQLFETPQVFAAIPSGIGHSAPAEIQAVIDSVRDLPFGAAALVGTGEGPGECQTLRTHVKRQLAPTFRVTARNHGTHYGYYVANDRNI